MSEQTKIQWTDHTGGPYLICTEVSPGCANCYARELVLSRLGHLVRKAYKAAGFLDWETRAVWGKTAPRVLSKGFWTDVLKWNKQSICDKCGDTHKADQAGRWHGELKPGKLCGGTYRRANVFPSLIDWLDKMPAGIIDQDGKLVDRIEVFTRFLKVIKDCQNLNFLLLTKRPENFESQMTDSMRFLEDHDPKDMDGLWAWILDWVTGEKIPGNVWIGFSAENNALMKSRWDAAKTIPAIVHFISAEPLLEDVAAALSYVLHDARGLGLNVWPILGGESGPGARPCNVEWIRRAVLLCQANNVRCFVKQLGANPISTVGWTGPLEMIKDKKGGDMAEWPADLRVREVPTLNLPEEANGNS